MSLYDHKKLSFKIESQILEGVTINNKFQLSGCLSVQRRFFFQPILLVLKMKGHLLCQIRKQNPTKP